MAVFTLFSYEFKGLYEMQQDMYDPELDKVDVHDSVARKQELFEKFFETENFPDEFRKGKRRFGCQLLWKMDHIIALRIENKKKLKRDIKYQTEELDNYPWVNVIIDNRHDVQHIAILKRPKAFTSNNFVAKIIQETIGAYLYQYRLELSVDPQYRSRLFWDTLKKFRPMGIKRIQFNFAFPNKDWATEMIGELATFSRNANGDILLGAEARKNEVLTFDENVPENQALVNACSGTGQDIVIKAEGMAAFHTLRTNNPVEQPMKDRLLKNLEDNKWNHDVMQDAVAFCDTCQKYYV